jgi:hypothetical protein
MKTKKKPLKTYIIICDHLGGKSNSFLCSVLSHSFASFYDINKLICIFFGKNLGNKNDIYYLFEFFLLQTS